MRIRIYSLAGRRAGKSTMCWGSRCCQIAGNMGPFAGGNELGTHSLGPTVNGFFHCHNRGHDPQVLQDRLTVALDKLHTLSHFPKGFTAQAQAQAQTASTHHGSAGNHRRSGEPESWPGSGDPTYTETVAPDLTLQQPPPSDPSGQLPSTFWPAAGLWSSRSGGKPQPLPGCSLCAATEG